MCIYMTFKGSNDIQFLVVLFVNFVNLMDVFFNFFCLEVVCFDFDSCFLFSNFSIILFQVIILKKMEGLDDRKPTAKEIAGVQVRFFNLLHIIVDIC